MHGALRNDVYGPRGPYGPYAPYGPCVPGSHTTSILHALSATIPVAPPLALAYGADELAFFIVYLVNAPFMLWYCLSVIVAVADTPSCFRAGSYLVVSALAYTALWFATPIGLAWTLAVLYSALALAHRAWIGGPDSFTALDVPRPRRPPPHGPPRNPPKVLWLIVQSPRGTARHVIPIRVDPADALP